MLTQYENTEPMMNSVHTFSQLQGNAGETGRSDTQGVGDIGCTPDRDRGRPATLLLPEDNENVTATGKFPWTAQCRDGLATRGDVVASGKTVVSPFMHFGEGTGRDREQRSTGTGGDRYPHDTMRHTRTAGRPRGRGVAGSGTAAVGDSSTGLCVSTMWRGTPPGGETGDLSFTVGFLHDTAESGASGRASTAWSPTANSSETAPRSVRSRQIYIDGRPGRPLQGNNTTIG